MAASAFRIVVPVLLGIGIAASTAVTPPARAAQAPAPQCRASDTVVRILAPTDQSRVPQQSMVTGTFGRPGAEVWLIVHPMRVADYWVQQSTRVRRNCQWAIQAHFGLPNLHAGERYEVMAVIAPAAPLRVAQVLPGWPGARYQSDLVQVVRR